MSNCNNVYFGESVTRVRQERTTLEVEDVVHNDHTCVTWYLTIKTKERVLYFKSYSMCIHREFYQYWNLNKLELKSKNQLVVIKLSDIKGR